MNLPVTLLCKVPSSDKEKRIEQALMCAKIDGYTDATAELSKFINKLYRERNENAQLIHHLLKPLIEQQDKNYESLCKALNEINKPETHTVKVIYQDGDYTITKINLTPEEIKEYYVDQIFNLGIESDLSKRCVDVEILI